MPWQPRQHLRVENVDDVIVVRFEDDQINLPLVAPYE